MISALRISYSFRDPVILPSKMEWMQVTYYIMSLLDLGQTVPHVHVHVYPEYDEKEVKIQESESKIL